MAQAPKKHFWIVWNGGRTEGFVTDDSYDAKQVASGNFVAGYTTVGAAFAEAYEDDDLTIERVLLPASVQP